MRSAILFCSALSFVIISCSTTHTVTDQWGTRQESRPWLSLGKGASKRKIYARTYPPSDLTKGLIDFHKRFHQWPKSINDLTAFSFVAMNAVNQMRSTSYEMLNIVYSSPDSLVIHYIYNPGLASDEDKTAMLFVDRKFPGNYIYTASQGNYLVDNSPDKKRKKRHVNQHRYKS